MATETAAPAFEPYEDQHAHSTSEANDVELVLKPADAGFEPLHREVVNVEVAGPYGQSAMPVTLEEYVTRYNQEVEAEDFKTGRCCFLIDTYRRMAYYLAMVLPMCVFPWIIAFQPKHRYVYGNNTPNHEAKEFHNVAFTAVFACIAVITAILTAICVGFFIRRPRARLASIVATCVWVIVAAVVHWCAFSLSRCTAYRNRTSDTSNFNCLPYWFVVGPLFAYPGIAVPLIITFLFTL